MHSNSRPTSDDSASPLFLLLGTSGRTRTSFAPLPFCTQQRDSHPPFLPRIPQFVIRYPPSAGETNRPLTLVRSMESESQAIRPGSNNNGAVQGQRRPASSEGPDVKDHHGEPSNKRKRIAMACDKCRSKKSRCDGMQPCCSMCRAGGYECIYRMALPPSRPSISATTPPSISADPTDIHRRFLEMEARLSQFEKDLRGRARNVIPSRERSVTETSYALDMVEEPGVQASVTLNAPTDPAANEPFSPEQSETSMGVLAFADEQVSGFFGPSSNVALIRHISNAIATTRDPTFSMTQVSSEIDNAIMSTSRPYPEAFANWVKAAGCKLYALPPDSQVIELARDYFLNTGLLFPYVHADTFFQTYASMKAENFKNIRASWLALFNMILANSMCSRTDDKLSFKERVSASEVFYQRAVGLTNQRKMQGMSLEIVQYLLLMTQYLQGCQRTVQTYAVHGQAVKSAFQIGLQSEEVSKRFAPLERETRKRVWYACVLIDRTLSVTFGRPSSIPDSYIKMEIPKPIPEWVVESHLVAQSMQGLAFFNCTIKLYTIMWAILERLYGQNIGENAAPEGESGIIRHVVLFEQQLEEWVASLPDNLKPFNGDWNDFKPEGISTSARLRTILTLRYLNIRCLLHRPVVMILLGNSSKLEAHDGSSPFNQSLVWQSVHSLLDAGNGVITIITKLGGHKKALGAYWFTLYYIFNAALVVFAVGLLCSDEAKMTTPKFEMLNRVNQSLAMAISALPTIDIGNGTIEKCRRYIEKLLEMNLLKNPTGTVDIRQNRFVTSRASPARFSYRTGQEGNPTHPDMRAFLPESQDWVLDDLDMGPFVMDSNFDFMDELPGYPMGSNFTS